jgi:hypothetical protein
MDYQVSLAPIDKLLISSSGIVEPLCNSCFSRDCSNPIERKTISVVGIMKKWRLYRLAISYMCVVGCQGYMPISRMDETDPVLGGSIKEGE